MCPHRFDDVRWVRETDSTNTRLLELARADAPEGIVLVADRQTAGRGRLGRRWEAAPGSALLVSALLRPMVALERAHLVTMAAALAAGDAVEDLGGGRTWLKWPNDVVYEDAGGTWKLAGILTESVVMGEALHALVVGMGMNVDARPTPGSEAVNTYRGGGPERITRASLLDAWLARLDRRLDALDAVLADYRRRCSTLGRSVRVELPEDAFEGHAVDVTDAGHLLVAADDAIRAVAVGDVVHLHVG